MADPRQNLKEKIQDALGLSANELDKLDLLAGCKVDERSEAYPRECWKIYNELAKQCLPTHVILPQAVHQDVWDEMAKYCKELEMLPEHVMPILFDLNGRDHKANPSPRLIAGPRAASFVVGNVEKKQVTMVDIVDTFEHTAIYCKWALKGPNLCRWMRRNNLLPAWVRIILLVQNDALDNTCVDLYREALSEWHRSGTLRNELLARGYELA